jgi:hypothetical protein
VNPLFGLWQYDRHRDSLHATKLGPTPANVTMYVVASSAALQAQADRLDLLPFGRTIYDHVPVPVTERGLLQDLNGAIIPRQTGPRALPSGSAGREAGLVRLNGQAREGRQP